jgi:hypothetical protein
MADVWLVEGDTLTARLSDRSGGELVFPVGLKHAVITGTLEWSGPVSQVQLESVRKVFTLLSGLCVGS